MVNGPNGETGLPVLDQPAPAATPQVEHIADAGDRSLERVAEIAKDKGLNIRMRVAVSLWDWSQYVAWKGQTWRVEVADKAAAEATKQAMELFFDVLSQVGPVEVMALLTVTPDEAGAGARGQETLDAAHKPA